MDYALIAYFLLAFGIVMYVILDGFDLGSGSYCPSPAAPTSANR